MSCKFVVCFVHALHVRWVCWWYVFRMWCILVVRVVCMCLACVGYASGKVLACLLYDLSRPAYSMFVVCCMYMCCILCVGFVYVCCMLCICLLYACCICCAWLSYECRILCVCGLYARGMRVVCVL